MPLDGITLGAVVYELNSVLMNAKIDKIYQPEKDELVLSMRAEGTTKHLLLSANASHPRIYLTQTQKPNPPAPPNFCMLLRKHLTGGRIAKIEQIGNERIVKIVILSANELGDITPKSLIIEIMGKYSNIIFINDGNLILDAIKHVTSEISRVREVLPHDEYILPDNQNKLDPFLSADKIISLLDGLESLPTPAHLSSNIVGISKQTAEEIVYRMQQAGSAVKGYQEFIADILGRRYYPVVLTDEAQSPIDFLPFKYRVYIPERQVAYPSMSEALEFYYRQRDLTLRIQSRSRELLNLLTILYERCKNKRAAQLKTLDECADMDKYRIMGELLTANIYRVQRGAACAEVPNYYSEQGETLVIPLDPKYSPAVNAQRYFKKYNKLKNASKLLLKQIEENDAETAYIESLLNNLSLCTSYDELSEIKEEMIQAGYISDNKKEKQTKNAALTEPLRYLSSDGTEILVGKNNRQNDRLTLKTASPADTWLHVKNMAGSHVIIRKSGAISDDTLYTAAMLAAYYSKAKNSSGVPVDYTLCKYVRKPAGAKPGMVIFDHNKTVNVTPDEGFVRKLNQDNL